MKKILISLFLLLFGFSIDASKIRIINNSGVPLIVQFFSPFSTFRDIHQSPAGSNIRFNRDGEIEKVLISSFSDGEILLEKDGHGNGDADYIITPDLRLQIRHAEEREL